MEVLQLLPNLYANFIGFMLVFTRIMALLLTFMIFRRQMVTAKVMLSLGALLTCYVMMLYPNSTSVKYDTLQLYFQIVIQTGIGLISALILNLILEVFIITGQIISTQVGLSISSLIDPNYGTITSLTDFYFVTAMILFFAINGHLFLIKFIIDNFNVIPINEITLSHHSLFDLIKYANIIFSDSLLLSLTIITVILMANIALAVMTRFAPQLNLFSIGISLQLVIGLILVYGTYSLFINHAQDIFKHGFQFLTHFYMHGAG